ncbi:hypothetical protein Taro_001471 [Colocasia esculenta]|uniref:Transmembrane protein n=1 Tax=Colocasia esculenta TaxID=4460 RepID=A0A843THY8_COLES|nr:hypothetical protein [Colocasia esculenta]
MLFGLLGKHRPGVCFRLCLSYAWETLVAVQCVASLPVVVGAVPCVCVLLRAIVVVVLLKLLVLCVFCLCGSLVQSPFRLALSRFRPLVCRRLGMFGFANLRRLSWFCLYACACGVLGLVFLWLYSRCVSWSDHEDDLGEI